MKIVINKCYGGFELANEALERLADLKSKGDLKKYYFQHVHLGKEWITFIKKNSDNESDMIVLLNEDFDEDIIEMPEKEFEKLDRKIINSHTYTYEYHMRTDKDLIAVVEELGKGANTICSKLEVVEIPDGSFWGIDSYDGWETVRYSESEIKVV